MMTTPLSVPSTAPAALAAAPPNTANPGSAPKTAHAGEPGAFARQLERAAQDGDAAEAPAAAAAQAPAAPNTARETSGERRGETRGKTRAGTERANAERPPIPSRRGEAADAAASPAGSADKAAATPDSTAAADVSSLLAGLLAQAQIQTHAPPTSPRAEAKTGAAEAGQRAAVGAATDTRAADTTTLQDADDGAPALRAQADAEATQPALRPEAAAFALPAAAPANSAPAAAEPAARAAAPAYEAQVNAALGTPEFAPGLSAEVSVMLRDGVQEARLQLNPAEMGPITVQIQIDGNSAQVNLAAEQHDTRQALEQAMPALAGALRENGLTLTGGGVFEQPRQPRDDNPPADGRGGKPGPDDGAPAAASAPARRFTPRGVVDLIA